MTFLSFRRLRKFLGPKWLVGEDDGELAGYALDVMKDAFVQRVFLGLLARLPETAPTDALAALGRDRRVTRGRTETEEAYAERLIRWLDDRKVAGNPFALMRKLSEYTGAGPSFRTVDARGNWYSRAADGTETALLKQENWDWDGADASRWSRFWVIIYPTGLWTELPNDWGDTDGDGWGGTQGATWGSTATAGDVQTIRFLVSDWKPQGTRCVNIILALDPDSFDPASPEPDGLWGGWSKNVGGVQVPSRLATARYWDGV